MIENKIIKILVSCPGDVNPEKEEIIRLCKDFSDENLGNSGISFKVLDWKDYVGRYGVRSQQQLNEYFGNYDVYIGILWKRFGTKPGSKNFNGKENESGTEEEFYIAIDNYKTQGKPKIYFFIKNYDRETKGSQETRQLLKVDEFVDKQIESKNNYINKFYSGSEYNSKIVRLLKSLEHEAEYDFKVEKKKVLISDKTKVKIAEFKTGLMKLPKAYIERSTSHFKLIKDKQSNPFLETEQQTLDQLMLTTKKVVLLGDAGSGKSTELRNLLFRLSQDNSPFIPILQNFNSYTPDYGLESFLPDFWKEVPSDLLLIIWDGLDEIEPKNFNTVVRQINTFSDKNKEIRILISCRTNFYELPINSSTGTLTGFEPYLIKDLTEKDAKDYFRRRYSFARSDNFITEVFEANLGDLITKPFFLMLLADQYNQEKKLQLNRAKLYEMFLLNRIELDQNHFKTTVDLRSKKQEIEMLLQKVALSMEILSKNQIRESEILALITSNEFNSIKYCTAFKKKDGEEDIWQFEHNNIQEFLAAKALSLLEFKKVIQFITFTSNHKKLIPSWVNTLAFLFSVLKTGSDLFNNLLEWMLENEKEIIVKFEPDIISEPLRVQIFQGIFNYYKEHDIWVRSNKFSDRELARFGQSELNLRFLIDEIKNENNTRTVTINAISLLGHFQIKNDDARAEVERLLLLQIDRYISDPNYIQVLIYSLRWAEFIEANTIKELMGKVGNQKNEYVRAAMYEILSKSDVLENYVDYLIEGYELIDKKRNSERYDVTLIDEEWNLKECVRNIKSPKGIKEIVAYISEGTRFEFEYDSEKIIDAIVNNAVEAYKNDDSIFKDFLSWFKKYIHGFSLEKINLILHFFDKTNTRMQAFQEVWESIGEDTERDKSLAIAKLLTPESMQYVIGEYLNHNLTNKELESIYFDLTLVNNEACEQFEKLIQEKTDFKLKKPKQVDHNALREKKLKADFDLLFDPNAFEEATIQIFERENKESLSFDELFEMRKKNNQWIDIDEYYSSVALRLLRNFVNKDQSVSKDKIKKWFEVSRDEENYRVARIYEYLTNHKELEVNARQEQWITQWCTENVTKINFKTAIEVNDDGSITYKTIAIIIWYFTRRYDVNHPKEVLLDMLSFDWVDGGDRGGIDYLIPKLDKKDIINRMLENMKEGISDDSVLKNHIKYLCQNETKESYPLILNEIINLKRNEYKRNEFLDLFFETTKDSESIKSIIDKADSRIKWTILDKLKANNQESFVEEYLLNALEKSIDDEEIAKIVDVLISLQNMQGLKTYVELIRKNVDDEVNPRHVECLNGIKTIKAIPFLVDLLELSYMRDIKVDRFNDFRSSILSAFNNIALVSESNFKQVKTSLQKFMDEKSSIHRNVKFILYSIERMEEQFYMNNAQSLTIKQVKEKLKLLN